jgi:Spy/CpxP family protein refolding chaperone
MTIKKKVLSVFAAGMLVVGMAFAAGQGPGGHHGMMGGGKRLDFMATALDLTAAQKETAKGIFDQAKTSAQPIRDQLKQNHEAMAAAIKAGKSEAELTQLATQEGTLMGQLAAIRAKAFSSFYAQLTPEQKTKADQLHQDMKARWQNRTGQQPATPQQ